MNVGPLAKILNSKPERDDTSRTQAWKALFEAGKLAQAEKSYEQADMLYQRAHAVYTKKAGDKGLVTAEILMQQAKLKEEMGDLAAARELKSKAREVIAEYAKNQDSGKEDLT